MADDIDTVLSWKTKECDEPNKCRIRIYWITWEKAIVIATDTPTNSCEKIANLTQQIISLVSTSYDVAPNKLMLIEHYSTDDLANEDIYFQVLVNDNEAIKYKIDRNRLVELIGKPI